MACRLAARRWLVQNVMANEETQASHISNRRRKREEEEEALEKKKKKKLILAIRMEPKTFKFLVV